MAATEKRLQEVLKEEASRKGVASLIVITAIIITLLAGGIAFGVQSLIGVESPG